MLLVPRLLWYWNDAPIVFGMPGCKTQLLRDAWIHRVLRFSFAFFIFIWNTRTTTPRRTIYVVFMPPRSRQSWKMCKVGVWKNTLKHKTLCVSGNTFYGIYFQRILGTHLNNKFWKGLTPVKMSLSVYHGTSDFHYIRTQIWYMLTSGEVNAPGEVVFGIVRHSWMSKQNDFNNQTKPVRSSKFQRALTETKLLATNAVCTGFFNFFCGCPRCLTTRNAVNVPKARTK